MTIRRAAVFSACALAFAGCFTVSETEYPAVAPIVRLKDSSRIAVSVRGFAATVTRYAAVEGYETVYVPGVYGRRCWAPGYCTTMRTTTNVPYFEQTDAYRLRAQDLLEQAGYVVAAATPTYVVDVTFAGPVDQNRTGLRFLWNLLTLFTYDESDYLCTAQLRVRDNRSGVLVFSRDYTQPRACGVFSPIPVFGISCCDQTHAAVAQTWCLTALTDRIASDVAAFLAAQPGEVGR